MREYDICYDCGKVTKISVRTLRIMKLLDLNVFDFKLRCSECKAKDITRLANVNYKKDKSYD